MDEPKKREESKIVELGGRRWRIDKFDALTGSYVAYKILMQALPMGLDGKLGLGDRQNMPTMSKADFRELQMDCLSVCHELKQVGGQEMAVQVMAPTGFGVPGLEKDMGLVMALTINAVMFNVAGFFDGNALKDLAGTMGNLSALAPSDAQT